MTRGLDCRVAKGVGDTEGCCPRAAGGGGRQWVGGTWGSWRQRADVLGRIGAETWLS